MAITTVRPNATASGTGLFVITGGPTTFQEALSDDSDSTYISKSSSIVGPTSAIVDFGTLTLSATQRVKQVRIRARCSTPTTAGQLNVYLGSRIDNQNYFHSALAIRGENSSATTFTGPYFNASPNGEEWSQAAINGLRGKITEYNETSAVGSIYELYVDVDVAAQPSTTVTAPTGTITTTTAPDVSWTFSDTDNETQAFYEIKIFNDGVYGGGGFSPDTSTSDWTSGEVASSDNTAVVGALLLPDVYRAYVRTAKAINGQPFWSAWAFVGFTISYTAPSIPSMVVNWSSTLGRAAFTLTGTAPSGYASQYYEIQRSDDDGVVYDAIRNGERLIPNNVNVATAVDYEAPRSLVAYYRCRSVGVDSSDNEFPSAWGTVQQVLITNDETWWFKAVDNPLLNKGGLRVQGDIEITIAEPNTVFRRLGEDRPVVVAGLLQGQDGRYLIKTLSETEWNDLLALVQYQGTLLVQDPFGNQKYIRITSRDLVEINAGGNIYRDVLLQYVQVGS